MQKSRTEQREPDQLVLLQKSKQECSDWKANKAESVLWLNHRGVQKLSKLRLSVKTGWKKSNEANYMRLKKKNSQWAQYGGENQNADAEQRRSSDWLWIYFFCWDQGAVNLSDFLMTRQQQI